MKTVISITVYNIYIYPFILNYIEKYENTFSSKIGFNAIFKNTAVFIKTIKNAYL